MKEQNYKNHAKLTPLYHIVLLLASLVFLVLSIINLIYYIRFADQNVWYVPALLFVGAIAMQIQIFLLRSFAAKNQDRIIRAEENFRHFAMTGKQLDPRLTPGQIIALRFASDDEYLSLVEQAIQKNLSNKEIKQQIKNWRADHMRI